MGKKVDIFSPDELSVRNKSLDSKRVIKVTNTNKIDYQKYDVMFVLDANELKRFGIRSDINFLGKKINIDHHEGDGIGEIKIINTKAGSTCTLLYYLFKDWKINLAGELLDMLLLGIVSDTDVFHFSTNNSSYIFKTVAEIIDKGADYEKALYDFDQSYNLKTLQFWAEAINRIQIDEKYRFVYTAIPYDVFNKYKEYGITSRQVSDRFLRNINDTDFGIVFIETEKGKVKVSIRTRTPGFFVLDLIKELGGGGHLTGGGTSVIGETFEKVIEKVLEVAREFSKSETKKY